MSDELKLRLIKELSNGNFHVGQLIIEVKGNNYYSESNNHETTKKDLPMEKLMDAVMNVQSNFWGNSSYAVIFCVCRDYYGYSDNMSQFERNIENLPFLILPKYTCPEGTISNTFKANPYMKMHVDKWESNGAKGRAIVLRDKFIHTVESLVADSKTT